MLGVSMHHHQPPQTVQQFGRVDAVEPDEIKQGSCAAPTAVSVCRSKPSALIA